MSTSTTSSEHFVASGSSKASPPRRQISRETIVVLREGSPGDVPLILLHGSEGTISCFSTLRKKFSSALWAIQLTPDTPIATLEEQVHYYYKKIKAKRPKGPYRLASFSATSIILIALAHMLEANGDEIQHLSFIDNFPAIHLAPGYGSEVSRDTVQGLKSCIDANMSIIGGLIRRDDGGDNARRHRLADDLAAGYQNPQDAAPHTRAFLGTVCSHTARVLKFLDTHGRDMEMFAAWMKGIRAPMTVYVASEGMIAHVPEVALSAEWYGFGVQRVFPYAEVVYVEGGHFEVLGHELVAAGLQAGQAAPMMMVQAQL
ncbi:hypothetical protein BDZ89DRAFT_1065026 [Hymenopellis radicata]|nr:hypothetical protein BDZ89DRAFT_1065026 [Hymenopellis radicata]